MKTLYRITVALFAVIISLPLFFFNFKENVLSEADNRMLCNNPFGPDSSVSDPVRVGEALDDYISDRIGFRNEMILAYSAINKAVFEIMSNPLYMYGKDDYIFFRKTQMPEFDEFRRDFAESIIKMSDYCKTKNIPFLFVFTPEKLAVMTDKLPDGINYNNEWKRDFFAVLDVGGVSYIDNTDILTERYKAGEMVFNRQYNAGHWNDLGAFYGVNNILEAMNNMGAEVHINEKNEFKISTTHRTHISELNLDIDEQEPRFTPKHRPEDLSDKYRKGLKLDENYNFFAYTENTRVTSPKTLVFQGSYMNDMGHKFLANALGEYIAVHDYQNVFELDYYVDHFSPEFVIFEVAEYTLLDMYFSHEAMKNLELK